MMKKPEGFEDNFAYEGMEPISKSAAEQILPKIISFLKPNSIIDFGCGEGVWLSIAKRIDSSIDVFGIDGDWVERSRLKIAPECFLGADLTNKISLGKKYDLAMSFEVAEHLEEKYADVFVDNMVRSADNILFGAAFPGLEKKGVGHVNEQWQSYWVEKFTKHGYKADLSFRNIFWTNSRIAPWRRMTLLYFTKEDIVPIVSDEIYDVVHPEMFMSRDISIKETYNALDNAIKKFVEAGQTNIVIYPFGETGFLCKEILNHKYNIKERAIIDNKLSRTTEGIYDCGYLADLQEDFVVVETCNNARIHQEVLDCINEVLHDKSQIVSAF